jgi:hypothetical protein
MWDIASGQPLIELNPVLPIEVPVSHFLGTAINSISIFDNNTFTSLGKDVNR